LWAASPRRAPVADITTAHISGAVRQQTRFPQHRASLTFRSSRREQMDTNTLIIIVLVVLLLGGGGFFFRRR
jgi:LPXTG-motif cell wall-anchored protein